MEKKIGRARKGNRWEK